MSSRKRPLSAYSAQNSTEHQRKYETTKQLPASRPVSARRIKLIPLNLSISKRAGAYTNVSNNFLNIRVDKKHIWKSTMNTNTDNMFNKTNNEEKEHSDDIEDYQSNNSPSRNNRSSYYSKFKYPEHFHQRSINKRTSLEHTIPGCMKHFPHCALLPVRQSCTHYPWASVTYLHKHCVHSVGLRHPNPIKENTIEKDRSTNVDTKKPELVYEDKKEILDRNRTSNFTYEEPKKVISYELELNEDNFSDKSDVLSISSFRSNAVE